MWGRRSEFRATHFELPCVWWVLLFVSSASAGVCRAEGFGVQQGESHLPSLASWGQKVWPYIPESRRCHLLRERAADCHRQARQRCVSGILGLAPLVVFESTGESVQRSSNPVFSCHQGSDSPSSSTPEEADTEDDGQAVSIRLLCQLTSFSTK